MMEEEKDFPVEKISKQPHHQSKGPCLTRPAYRQGKKHTAVKVYTVNNESQHLIIRGVPALNLFYEVKRLCLRYGEAKVTVIKDYAEDEEKFTQVFHVFYSRIQSARFAKHQLDNKSFFGGLLRVYYAPELETLAQTRTKLQTRRKEIASRLNKMEQQEAVLRSEVPIESALLQANFKDEHSTQYAEKTPQKDTPTCKTETSASDNSGSMKRSWSAFNSKYGKRPFKKKSL